VSNFEQTATAPRSEFWHWMHGTGGAGAMSVTDQFWQYAKEAILSASSAQTDEERQGLLELAGTWTQAALLERQSINHDSPAEAGAA
jgi:hypothetical protein